MKSDLAPLVHLMHAPRYCTIATQSIQMPGYPYATVVPNILDEHHCPILLVSELAEHTKNIQIDGKVSVSFVEPGVQNVQLAGRLSLIGDAEHFDASDTLKARYLRYLPEAEQYLSLDFMFFRIRPKRLRFIAGLGKMGWIEAAELACATLSLQDEITLLGKAKLFTPDDIKILGIDCYGVDYASTEHQKRYRFSDAISSCDQIETAIASIIPHLN